MYLLIFIADFLIKKPSTMMNLDIVKHNYMNYLQLSTIDLLNTIEFA